MEGLLEGRPAKAVPQAVALEVGLEHVDSVKLVAVGLRLDVLLPLVVLVAAAHLLALVVDLRLSGGAIPVHKVGA